MSDFGICPDPAFQKNQESLTCDLPEEAYQALTNSSEPSPDYFVPSGSKGSEAKLSLSEFHNQIHEAAFKGYSTAPARSFWQTPSWAFSFSPLALAACNKESKKHPYPNIEKLATVPFVKSDPNKCLTTSYRETVEIEGNKDVGTIYFIRQSHRSHGLPEEVALLVTDFQFGILRFLASRKARYIFEEGLTSDVPPNDPLHQKRRNIQIKKTFLREGGISKDLGNREEDEFRRWFIWGSTGGVVYAFVFNSDKNQIHLYKTLTKAEKYQKTKTLSDYKIYLDKKEQWAAREIRKFLKQKPGETLYLIYGGLHHFKDDFESMKNPPTLISVDFPEFTDRHIEIITGKKPKLETCRKLKDDTPTYLSKLHKLKNDDVKGLSLFINDSKNLPNLQGWAILKADKLEDWIFQNIQFPQSQLMALDKLEFDEKKWRLRSNVPLSEYLLKYSLTPKVREKILSKLPKFKR